MTNDIWKHAPEGATEIVFSVGNGVIFFANTHHVWYSNKDKRERHPLFYETILTRPDIHGEMPEMIDGDKAVMRDGECFLSLNGRWCSHTSNESLLNGDQLASLYRGGVLIWERKPEKKRLTKEQVEALREFADKSRHSQSTVDLDVTAYIKERGVTNETTY